MKCEFLHLDFPNIVQEIKSQCIGNIGVVKVCAMAPHSGHQDIRGRENFTADIFYSLSQIIDNLDNLDFGRFSEENMGNFGIY